MSISISAQEHVPDVSAEQRKADRTRKQLRKLRWIGREIDAGRVVQALTEASHRTWVASERRL
jgi:hypothetical protein